MFHAGMRTSLHERSCEHQEANTTGCTFLDGSAAFLATVRYTKTSRLAGSLRWVQLRASWASRRGVSGQLRAVQRVLGAWQHNTPTMRADERQGCCSLKTECCRTAGYASRVNAYLGRLWLAAHAVTQADNAWPQRGGAVLLLTTIRARCSILSDLGLGQPVHTAGQSGGRHDDTALGLAFIVAVARLLGQINGGNQHLGHGACAQRLEDDRLRLGQISQIGAGLQRLISRKKTKVPYISRQIDILARACIRSQLKYVEHHNE